MNDPILDPKPDAAADDSHVSADDASAGDPAADASAASAADDPSAVPPAGLAPADPPPPAPAAAPPAGGLGRHGLAVVAVVALVGVLAFAGGFATGRVSAPEAVAAPTTQPTPDATAQQTPAAAGQPTPVASAGATIESDGARLGRADAKVVVDYWADYQCPFCSKFAQTVIPQLESRLADGTLALVHRDFAFIGPESFAASAAVRCADREGKYWPMHDAVYAAQDGENQGAFAADRLNAIAASVGLDAEAFATCLDDHAVLVDVLDDTAAGNRAGIESTPTLDVNGTRLKGVPDAATLIAAIDAAAAGASPAPAPSAAPADDPWASVATDGRTAGNPAAPVTVELWMDYQSQGYVDLVKSLEADLRTRVADGRARVELRDLALSGDESVVAGSTVRCVAAQRGPAWLVHDILGVSAQGAGSGLYTIDNVLQFAARIGLHVRDLDTCLADPTVAQAVRDETAQGSAKGLKEGPTIVVRKGDKELGRFAGTIDPKKVLAAIDRAK